jgi:hypothetical protein
VGRGRVRALGQRGPAPVRRPRRSRPLDAVRLRPRRREAVPAQLPGLQPLRRLPLHPLRRELRAGRGGPERDRRPGPQPVVLRNADGDARTDLLPRLRHPRLRLLRALQAHDRARGLLDVPDAGRGLQLHPEIRRGRLLPRHQPDRLLARPALLRETPRADQACPTNSSTGGSCRPTSDHGQAGNFDFVLVSVFGPTSSQAPLAPHVTSSNPAPSSPWASTSVRRPSSRSSAQRLQPDTPASR